MPSQSVGATLRSSQTICYNTTPSDLTVITAHTGGADNYTYQWYASTGSAINGATNSTYSPGVLAATTTFTAESFDGTTFPPNGWSAIDISSPDGTFNWDRTTTGVDMTEAPHSGAGEAWYDSYNAGGGDEAILVSPSFTETGNTTGATVSFWMYGDPNDQNYDAINVWYSTNATQPIDLSGASLLGTAYEVNAMSAGWYQYTYTIPGSVRSSHCLAYFWMLCQITVTTTDLREKRCTLMMYHGLQK